jgi:hypothetical protein
MYPKYKMGEEVVRKVAVPPTYSKYKNKLCIHCTIDSVRGFNNSYLFHKYELLSFPSLYVELCLR